jgi:hypothetical protein
VVDERVAWIRRGTDKELATLGADTATAAGALDAVRDKLEDFFTRCRVAAYDPRGAAVADADRRTGAAIRIRFEPARLPLAAIDPRARSQRPNWRGRGSTGSSSVVVPTLGRRDAPVAADPAVIVERFAPYAAWQASEPKTPVDALDPVWLERLTGPELRDKLRALIGADAALAGEYEQITSVAKLVRLQRDLGRIVRNFVNFSEFYGAQDGAFQIGTLYLDARALHLCVLCRGPGKARGTRDIVGFVSIYRDISRKGETRQHRGRASPTATPTTSSSAQRHLHDRKNDDWDATVVKVISNPISIREAFWTPYKKVVRTTRTTSRGGPRPQMPRRQPSSTRSLRRPRNRPRSSKKIDPEPSPRSASRSAESHAGRALLASMFGLGPWLPLGLIALMLLVSGPSMVLAWLKPGRRNLGPILDANVVGPSMAARGSTSRSALRDRAREAPKGSQRKLEDPFADKRTPWKRHGAGRPPSCSPARGTSVSSITTLDTIRSTTVLGEHAPTKP